MAGERFEEAKAICDRLTTRYPDAEYGPAHVVVSDYNFEDDFVNGCRQTIDLLLAHGVAETAEHGRTELEHTRAALDVLLAIPEDERCCPDEEE